MTTKSITLGLMAFSAAGVLALPSAAQESPAPVQEEILTDPADAAARPTGPQWMAFSRSTTNAFLIDVNSVVRDGEEAAVKIARVGLSRPAGDYSHAIDDFAVRCEANQSHLVASTEAFEDGEPTETFAADEPWAAIQSGSFDDAIKQIACGDAVPTGDPYPTVADYIDAGRP